VAVSASSSPIVPLLPWLSLHPLSNNPELRRSGLTVEPPGDPSYPRDPPVSRLARFAGIMQTAPMLSKSELARILIDHSWSNLEDWACALRDLATLSDRDVEQLERQAPPRPAPCSGD